MIVPRCRAWMQLLPLLLHSRASGIYCRIAPASDHKPSTNYHDRQSVLAVVDRACHRLTLREGAYGSRLSPSGAPSSAADSPVMEAAARGTTEARVAIGVLPDEDRSRQNGYLAYSVATGVGQARNLAVVVQGRCHRGRWRVRYALGDRARQKSRAARGGPRGLEPRGTRGRGVLAA